jgi:hypothetical protein
MKSFSRPLNQARRLTIPLRDLDPAGNSLRRLKEMLQEATGVISVYVSPNTEAAYIIYDPLETSPGALYQIVQDAEVQTEEWRDHTPPRGAGETPQTES